MRPASSTARETGASFSKDKCVQAENLVSAASRFVIERGLRHSRVLSEIPLRVQRLVELGDERRASGDPSYLDFSYWDGMDDASEELAGLVTFRDRRE
jgi:hypothetical protein